jgi:hypothetical protein
MVMDQQPQKKGGYIQSNQASSIPATRTESPAPKGSTLENP